MASTYTPLGVELQATGENAGDGVRKLILIYNFDRTNNWWIIQKSLAGGSGNYNFISLLMVQLNAFTSAHRMIEFYRIYYK